MKLRDAIILTLLIGLVVSLGYLAITLLVSLIPALITGVFHSIVYIGSLL